MCCLGLDILRLCAWAAGVHACACLCVCILRFASDCLHEASCVGACVHACIRVIKGHAHVLLRQAAHARESPCAVDVACGRLSARVCQAWRMRVLAHMRLHVYTCFYLLDEWTYACFPALNRRA
jgi:hypothetical protein